MREIEDVLEVLELHGYNSEERFKANLRKMLERIAIVAMEKMASNITDSIRGMQNEDVSVESQQDWRDWQEKQRKEDNAQLNDILEEHQRK
jgi:hypothetical protein